MLRIAAALCVAAGLARGASETEHQRGVEFYKQQKYIEAIAALQTAAKTESPASTEYQESALLIGQSYFALGQPPQAIPWLEKVTSSNEANYMLGYAYLQTRQLDKSEAAFARLFGVKPESAAGHLVAAQMLVKRELENYAIPEVKKAIEIDPKLPGAHFLLGEIAIYSGRLDEGLAEMNQELAISPGFSMAWYRRGDIYTRQEQWSAAIPDLERAVWLNSDFSGPYILLGKCYFKMNNLDNAEQILRRALQLDPQNSTATYLLSQTLFKEGKKDEARQLLSKVRAAKEEHQ